LAGRTDLEDALKKLDRLTQEEARMALAEVLRVSHSVRDGVKVVEGKVESRGDRMEDKVRCVDEKVQVVIEGERVYPASLQYVLKLLSDGKKARLKAEEGKSIIQQTAISVDEIKCS
jgi:hypothetical protein